MRRIIDGVRYWGQLLLLPLYGLSFLFPRDKHIWLFGSTFGRRFADNPRYLYQYVSQHKKELGIRSIWLSHDKEIVKFLGENGYEAYYYHSLRGIWFALRAKVYIFDNYSKDINFWQSGGAMKVNLWHGVGNKRINYDNEFDLVRHPKNLWEKWKYFPRRLSDEKPSHYVLATSPLMGDIFARAFQVSRNHIIECGYPRNDILYLKDTEDMLFTEEEKRVRQYIQKKCVEGNRIVGYMPTFRQSETKFMEIMDLERFNDFLQINQLFFVCKLHPKSKLRDVFEKIKYSNIYIINAEVDANSFLNMVDVLVADYSSVYSDFMLLNRPVVAFWYDIEEYLGETRGTYFDFEEYMPERQAYSMIELEEALLEVLHEDIMSEKRQRSCNTIFSYANAQTSSQLVEKIHKLYS